MNIKPISVQFLDRSFSFVRSRLILMISILFIPVFAHSGLEVSNPIRHLEVVVVKGEEMPLILGQLATEHSLMAVENGQLTAIPYQFDDKNSKGLTFVPGGKLTVKGSVDFIDSFDELVFMYKDMGEKVGSDALEGRRGVIVSELEITEEGISRYAYLVKGNGERSTKRYTDYNFETGYLETESYSLQFDPDTILVWEDWKIKGFTGTGSAPNILDTMKARINLRMGFLKARLHNSLVPVSMVGVKNGPVRSIVEGDATLGIFGLDIFSAGVSVTFTAQTIEYPIFAVFPATAALLSEISIDVTLDYVDFEGSRYRTALGPKEPLITGVEVPNEIRSQYKSDLDNPWVSISTGKNWDMFFRFQIPEGIRPTLSALYRDTGAGDKRNKPERYKGSSSELGIQLADIPTGIETILEYSLYFGPNLWQGNNPEKAWFDITHPAIVTVNPSLMASN